MNEGSWVGLDVHARSVVAGVLDAGSGELRTLRVPVGCEEAVAWLGRLPAPVRVAYEAGPTGYGLARACSAAGIACTVAAPSRIPRAAADRVKTDRRDAERLARLLRLGELVAVRVPEPDEEAARDLVRAREDVRGDLMRARHRLSKLLLRHGLVYEGSAWTVAHDKWLRRQSFASRPLRVALEESYGAMLHTKTRRDALDLAIAELAAEPPFADIVGRLVCLRGVSTLTGLALTVELGDWTRFTPQALGPFLGLTPSEDSSGQRRRLGSITKAGNSHARRLLVEAAWHQRRPPRPSTVLEKRRLGQPAAVRAQADRSARRLHQRWQALEGRGKRRSIVAVAVARELTGHLGRWQRPTNHQPQTVRRGERSGETTRGATRESSTSSPTGRRPILESGTTPHLAHPVMRSQPAHISRDTDVDTSRCAPPAETKPANSGPISALPLDNPSSISLEPRVRDEQGAVGRQLHAGEVRAEGCERDRVVERNDRPVVVDDLLRHVVERRPRLDARRLQPVARGSGRAAGWSSRCSSLDPEVATSR